MLLLAIGILSLDQVYAQQGVLFLEDWDTTPELPNELRGWQNASNGLGALDFDEQNGSFFNSFSFGTPLLLIGTSSSPDFSTWLTNAYVGNKNYRELEVTSVKLDLVHRTVPFLIQNTGANISILFAAAELVDDPNVPGNQTIPFIWTVAENMLMRDESWHTFEFDIPYAATSPPDGWFVYPESDENWNLVMTQVDDIRICFCPFQIGIGGVPLSWDIGLDNFTVITSDPLDAQPVPSSSQFGIYVSILLIGLLGIGWFLSNRVNLQA